MRSVSPSAIGLVCAALVGACATVEDARTFPGATGGAPSGAGGSGGSGAPGGSGGNAAGSGGQAPGAGGGSFGTGGGSSGSGGGGGSATNTGGTSGTGGGGCFLGVCPAGGTGGALSTPDAGASHKAMCNQKLCIDPVFDCILQGCGDAICQIPYCVIK